MAKTTLYFQNKKLFYSFRRKLQGILGAGGYRQGKSPADKKANTFSIMLKVSPLTGNYTVTVFVKQISKITLLKKITTLQYSSV